MVRALLIIAIVFSCCDSQAQVAMKSFSDYLSGQLNNNALTPLDKSNLYSIYFNSPLIDEAEFRTETNEFDLSQMEYTLRLRGNSKNIRRYQNQIYQDLKAEYFFELGQTQEDLVEELYQNYITHYFDIEKLNLRKRILPIYEDIITVLSKEDLDGDLSVTDLIEESRKRDKLQLAIDFETEKLKQNDLLSGMDTQALIDVEGMEKVLAELQLGIGTQMSPIEKFELDKIEHQYQLEKAERDQRWDFTQIKFRGDPEDTWQEQVSIGLGFRFPHSSKNSLDMIELQLEKMIEEEKYNRRKAEYEADSAEKYVEFGEQLANYNASVKLIEKLKKYDELTQNLTPSSKREIINILSLNIDAIEEELNLLDAKEDLYESYVEVLKVMGIFVRTPRIDYLSPR